ncbi:hypothetical protein GCM10011351_26620 [Paraliobacillus quinghaiensis]|uniref:Peptidase M15A C-terminal domain-containing protein n=1 Tax=Paraliobacillus quinghaiensis TaxID=470815 RepID=A0A917TVB7_9BACI|nr:D-Ala-D-Ala carboxypeptidase family metallohydrolase [Paraliobacillus quinghaiensis]GGM39122.1 hypothetical protein GCM10011351_26620 [Paraliobacillus quinghaiensis]
MKKIVITMLTAILFISLFSSVGFAHHNGTNATYPKYVNYRSDLNNLDFKVWIFDEATSNWSLQILKGSDQLTTGLYVREHASWSSNNKKLYTNYVITSTRFLEAFTKMRNEKGPITVLSGMRDPYHNRSIGSSAALYSQHQSGMAIDPRVPSGSEGSWAWRAEEVWGFTYAYTKSGAIHADTRTTSGGFPTLYSGAKNPYVFTLEMALHYHGYSPYKSGYYGSGDVSDAENFQSDHGLYSDGIVGSNTWRELMEGDYHTPW